MDGNLVIYSKKIPISQGKFTIVSYWRYAFLMQWKWFVHTNGKKTHSYAGSVIGKRKFLMHRIILGLLLGDKRQGDHIDHDTLNNCDNNIRIATHGENMRNRNSSSSATSSYIGVYKRMDVNNDGSINYWWVATIKVSGIKHHLGSFPFTEQGEIEAAKERDKAAIKYFKEFAKINFPVPSHDVVPLSIT